MAGIKGIAAALVLTFGVGEAAALEPVLAYFDFGYQCLMGGAEDGAFLDADTAAPLMTTKQRYRVFTLEDDFGHLTGAPPVAGDEPCPWALKVPVGAVAGDIGDAIAIGTERNPRPATLRLADPAQATYQDAVGAFLRERGFKAPEVAIQQIIRTDLEADGVEEVLITASNQNFETGGGEPGTYSLILLRRVADSGVETVPVVEALFPREDPEGLAYSFKVVAVLDLDGDGGQEIIIRADYYEGSSIEAYQVNGGGAEVVLTCGCGL